MSNAPLSIQYTVHLVGLLALLAGIPACGASSPVQPQKAAPWPEPDLVLIWHGYGKGTLHTEGGPERKPAQDYEFVVVQRRYADRWESTKEMHRRHPDYDGSAGPRDQTHHFTLRLDPASPHAGSVPVRIASTLGDGSGTTDREFRNATLRLEANVSSFAPFDHYEIRQHYAYEQGKLQETVLLLDTSGGKSRVWFQSEEQATLYAHHEFSEAPTRARGSAHARR